ncbi:hypothetical protein [Arthrobacter sp. N199823]|nr:hypothetical protein [Arthrobacter sp. N199823]
MELIPHFPELSQRHMVSAENFQDYMDENAGFAFTPMDCWWV